MKAFAIFGIFFSLIGIAVGVLFIMSAFNALDLEGIYEIYKGDLMAILFIIGFAVLSVNIFFLTFSITVLVRSFRRKISN